MFNPVTVRIAAIAVALLGIGVSCAPAQRLASGSQRLDATILFRSEMVDAPVRMKWKGPSLTDETLLALAAGGIASQPEYAGVPLLRRNKGRLAYNDAGKRLEAFQAASRAGREREAFPFALSLALSPAAGGAGWRNARAWLQRYGADYERILMGVIQAPDRLPVLPAYGYSAADLLALQGSRRLLPFYLTLAESSDRFLRSRGIAGAGAAAYRATPPGRTFARDAAQPREASISAVERRMIDEAIRRAGHDKNWRVRAAAAYALGLCGEEADFALLDRLSRDRAYLQDGDKRGARVRYPVRACAAAALAPFGRGAGCETGGVCAGKDLQRLTRGGQNVTRDRGDVKPSLLDAIVCRPLPF